MTSERPVWALVPVKRTTHAKQRLAAVLSPPERGALALALAEDVLAALADTASLDGVAVVTEDPAAQRLARRVGARVITEAAGDGYTAAVAGGTGALRRDGAAAVLVLPADVPLATGAEIGTVIAAHDDGPAFTIVPSRDRFGSNCILRSPPESVALWFGPDSYRRHLAAARSAGIAPRVVEAAGIACDLDTPQDVDDFLAMNAATRATDMLAGINWTRRRQGARHQDMIGCLETRRRPTMADAKLASNLAQWQLDHANRYLSSGGTDGHMYTITPPGYPEMTVPSLLLTTTGRKSGEELIFPLFYGNVGDSYVIVASKGGAPDHPSWYKNLVANPQVEIQVGTKTLKATARTVAGEERARLWQQALEFWPPYADYEKKTEREIPVVVLDPI